MFLFKLTFPVLGTATLGAAGTGIYYGVESWKNNSKKSSKNGVGNNKKTETHEKAPKEQVPSPKETEASSPPATDSISETERPSFPTVTVHSETDTEETK